VRDLVWLGQRLAEAGQADIRELAPGVPTAELIVMYDLLDHGPSTITDLAERTGYVQSRVSSAVVGLCERNWAQTRSDPSDGRRTIVYVPQEAQRQARQVQARNATGEVLHPLLAELTWRELLYQQTEPLNAALSAGGGATTRDTATAPPAAITIAAATAVTRRHMRCLRSAAARSSSARSAASGRSPASRAAGPASSRTSLVTSAAGTLPSRPGSPASPASSSRQPKHPAR